MLDLLCICVSKCVNVCVPVLWFFFFCHFLFCLVITLIVHLCSLCFPAPVIVCSVLIDSTCPSPTQTVTSCRSHLSFVSSTADLPACPLLFLSELLFGRISSHQICICYLSPFPVSFPFLFVQPVCVVLSLQFGSPWIKNWHVTQRLATYWVYLPSCPCSMLVAGIHSNAVKFCTQ